MTDRLPQPPDGAPDGAPRQDPAMADLSAGAEWPSESEWLDLPLPPELLHDAGAFTDRVLAALRTERQLDADLADLDRDLPAELLEQFDAPAPAPDFLASTMARLATDRRQRWQELLARHVAPEPSPAFVSRTLSALQRRDDDDGGAPGGHARPPGTGRSLRFPRWLALAAAAALLAWLGLANGLHWSNWPGRAPARPPLELRLATTVASSSAYAEASTPLTAMLLQVARAEEPGSLFDDRTDGLWLRAASGELR